MRASDRTAGEWRPISILAWGLVLVPLWLHLIYLPSFGELQNGDYYGVLDRLSDGAQLKSDLATWLNIRIVYHRVTVPALIWLLNIHFFHASNYVTAVLALAFLAAVFGVLVRHLPGTGPERWLLRAVISVLAFAPQAAYNIALSFGGIHYYLADLLVIVSIAVLVRFTGSRFGPWPLVILGLVGSFTFSSHLAAWPALFVGALLLRRRLRDFAVIALAAGIAYTVFLWGIHPFSKSSSSWPGTGLIVDYLGIFLGSLFTKDPGVARYLGWAGLVLSATLQPLVHLRLPAARPRIAFWLTVQLYALGNGFMAAVARGAEYGADQAMTARYELFVALFWAGAAVAGALLVRDVVGLRRSGVIFALTLVLTAVVAPLYAKGFRTMTYFAQRGQRQEVAALGMRWSCWDEKLIRGTICRFPDRLIDRVELMRNLGHVPFDREEPEMSRQQVPGSLLADRPHPEIEGVLNEVGSTSCPRLLRVRGWARHPEQAVEEVIFIDGRRRRRSRILLGRDRRDLVRRLGRRAAGRAGWEGFVTWRRQREPFWTAYVRLASDPTFYPIAQSHSAGEHLRELLAQPPGPAREGHDDVVEEMPRD